jgi:glycosyl transferase family 87
MKNSARLSNSVPYLPRTLVLAVPAVLIGVQLSWWVLCLISREHQRAADFRAYYAAGRMVLDGNAHLLYDLRKVAEVQNLWVAADNDTKLFIHPAYEAWLFAPISHCHFYAAYLTWVVVNVALVISVFRLMKPHNTLQPWMLFAYLPVSVAIAQGQDSIILGVLLIAAFNRLCQGQTFAAGVLIGLGTFRFQYTLVLVGFFLLWKVWRLALGYALSTAIAVLLSILVAGWHAQSQYLSLLRTIANSPTRMPLSFADRTTQPLLYMVNLRGALAAMGSTRIVLVAIVCLAPACFTYLIGRSRRDPERLLIAMITACLISYHTFAHDLSLLILPFICMFTMMLDRHNPGCLAALAFAFAAPEVIAATLPVSDTWLNSFGVLGALAIYPFCGVSGDSNSGGCRMLDYNGNSIL